LQLKKWAARISSQFIQRYGNPRYASEENQAFANYFRANTAAQLLAPTMNVLATKARGGFITDEVHRMCIGYVSSCVEMSPTYKVVKPHLHYVITSIVFPTLCLTDEDIRYAVGTRLVLRLPLSVLLNLFAAFYQISVQLICSLISLSFSSCNYCNTIR
jgi:hypothetical protein